MVDTTQSVTPIFGGTALEYRMKGDPIPNMGTYEGTKPELIQDWIGVDTRSGPTLKTLRLTLDDIPAAFTIEPFLTDQWFVKAGPLAAPAIAAVEDGRIRIVPVRVVQRGGGRAYIERGVEPGERVCLFMDRVAPLNRR